MKYAYSKIIFAILLSAFMILFFLSVALSQEYQPDAFTVALWHLDGNGLDASGHGNDLTIQGNPQFVAGCPQVQGSSNAIQPHNAFSVPNPDLIFTESVKYPGSGGWTIECWVKFDHLFDNNPEKRGWIIQQYTPGIAGYEPYVLGIWNRNLYFHIQSNTNQVLAVTADASPYVGQWIHLAAVYDPGSIKLYVNGQLIAQKAGNIAPESRSARTYVASQWDFTHGHSYDFAIDEIRISNKARQPSEFNLGSRLKRLTNSPNREGWYCWSPDGKQIAYIEQKDPLDNRKNLLKIVDLDGTNEAILYQGVGIGYGYAVDWVGNHIAFIKDHRYVSNPEYFETCDGDIYWISPNGGNLKRLTNTVLGAPSGVHTFRWGNAGDSVGTVSDVIRLTPNLLNIAFIAHDGNGWYHPYIGSVDNLANVVHINDYGHLNGLYLSQDGSFILYEKALNWNLSHEIHKVSINGTNDKVLVTGLQVSDGLEFAISPDMNQFVFTSNQEKNRDITLMNINGTGLQHLVTTSQDEFFSHLPDRSYQRRNPKGIWSPDGKKILFTRLNQYGKGDIYMIDLESKTQTQLTQNPENDFDASFSPDGSKIAFISDRSGSQDIWILNLGSAPPQGINLNFSNIDVKNFPTIVLTATVTDNQGNPISGLSMTNFSVQENNQLQNILNLSQTQNQYKITYTTPNPNRDGTTRTVKITVSYQGASDTKSKTYVAPSQPPTQGGSIYPVANTVQTVGQAFFVDIKVGSNSNPVTNLFGLSFVLNFTNTNYIDVVSPYNTNIVQGPFLGNDVVFYSSVDEAAGKVSIGISRKAGQGGVSGSGVVVRVKFIAKSNTPNGMQVKFSISDIIANDPNGNTITLTPSGLIITINSMVVWPGDTDNNGQVNQADVLPIGLCWNKTGPPRPNASISWVAQPATPWVPESCTYADANGDGIVNQADVLPIGLNWGRSHSSSSSQVSGVMPTGADIFSGNLNLKINGKGNPGELFWVEIYAEAVTDLFGISFELVYNPTTYVQAESVEPGAWFGDDLVFFPNIDNTLGKVSVGISRKAGQGGISGSGLIARIKMKMAANAPMGYKTNLTLQNVQANDPMGNSISFDLGQGIIVTEVKSGTDTHLPAHFQLFENYPNPFNPETIITYEIPKPTVVQLDIFNLLGKHIYSLVNHKPQQAGKYRVKWNGRDQYGQPVPGGMYIYQLKAGDFIQARKMVLLR